MSIYSIITEQNSIILRNLAEQQKNQRVIKIKNKILRQTHDKKLAEILSPITEKLSEVNESTKKLGDVFEKTDSHFENVQEIVPVEIISQDEKTNIKTLPNCSNLRNSMRETLGSLMNSRISLKVIPDQYGKANILGIPIQISGQDSFKINENFYDLTPKIYKALSSTSYPGETMRKKIF